MVTRKEAAAEVTTSNVTAEAISKIKKADAKRAEKKERKAEHGIIMLEHIPHGFFEDQLKEYFEQFGKVLRVKLARSKKTGQSKGYAFVEFEFQDVAKIAAESMNNYLMFEKLVKCKVLEPGAKSNKIFGDRFIRADNYPRLKARNAAKAMQELPKTEVEQKVTLVKRVRRLKTQNAKLEKLGITYQFGSKKLLALKRAKKVKAASAENGTELKTPKASPKAGSAKSTPLNPKIAPAITPATSKKSNTPTAKKTPNGTPQPKVTPNKKIQSPKQVTSPVDDSIAKAEAVKDAVVAASLAAKSPKGKKNKRKSANASVTQSPAVASTIELTPGKSPKGKKNKAQSVNVSQNASPAVAVGTPINGTPAKSPKGKKNKTQNANASQNASPAIIVSTPTNAGTPTKSPKGKKSKTQNANASQNASPAIAVSTPTNVGTPAKSPKGKKNKRKSLEVSQTDSPKVATPIGADAQAKSPKSAKKLKQSPKQSPKQPSKPTTPVSAISPATKTPKGKVTTPVAAPLEPITPDSPVGKKAKLGKRKSDSPIAEAPARKSPKTPPQKSPVVLKEDPVISESVVQEDEPKAKKGRKSTQLPRVSPKLLRSKMRQSESALTPLTKKELKAEKTTPVVESAAELPLKKTKFSPKLLRSRKGKDQLETSAVESPTAAAKGKGKKKDGPSPKTGKPKFSPKLLRSKSQRHSEDLTTGLTPIPKQQVKGRKSMRV